MDIRAFNLVRGAVFDTNVPDDDLALPVRYVVRAVTHNVDDETVRIVARNTHTFDADSDVIDLDFCDTVDLIGLCVNPDDIDDEDFGVDL